MNEPAPTSALPGTRPPEGGLPGSSLALVREQVLDAWNTATGMVRFVKWLSTFATALAVLYATVKGLSGR